MKWVRVLAIASGAFAVGDGAFAQDTGPEIGPAPRVVDPPPLRKGRPGEVNTPAARGERIADKLKVGDLAPDFTLPLLKGKGEVTLSKIRARKPVVLIFASYT